MDERVPLPIPFGWFRVADSEKLPAGEVRPVRYAGRDLAPFRDQAGALHALDAQCPRVDVPIWENRRCLEKPLLRDGDGPIGVVRMYYAPFYV